jgi:guanylate kinase
MLVLLIGKSGCGKSEIAKHFQELIAFTTRKMRDNEIDGIQYHFKDKTYIENEISKLKGTPDDFILEYGKYGEHYYGTLKSEFDEKISKYDIVVNTSEIEGALVMRKKFPNLVRLIWVDVNESIRVKRLMGRAVETGESESNIHERINEDFRNKEQALCDYTIHNNVSIYNAVNAIKRYVEILKNENKIGALDALKLLKQEITSQEMIWKYYEMMIEYDMYQKSYKKNNSVDATINKIEQDISYFKSIEQFQNMHVTNAINVVRDYLNAVQTELAMNLS